MIEKKDYGQINYGINLCGAFSAFPKTENPGDYFAQLQKEIRKAANKGCSYVLIWNPIPFVSPSKTPAWKRDYQIVKPAIDKDAWSQVLNDKYFHNILAMVYNTCLECNIKLVLGLTGFTRAATALFPYDQRFPANSMYGEDCLRFYKAVLFRLKKDFPGIMIEIANEPYANPYRGDKDAVDRATYQIVKFHIALIEYGKSIGFKESDFWVNFPWGLMPAAIRGKYDVLKQSYDEIKAMDESKTTMHRSQVGMTAHNIFSLKDALDSGLMVLPKDNIFSLKDALDSGLMVLPKDNDDDQDKYRRLLEWVIPSADGAAKKEGGLYGEELNDTFYKIGMHAKKFNIGNQGRRTTLMSHPRGIYELVGGQKAYEKHTIHLESINLEKYVQYMADAYKRIYNRYPENYGKYPDSKPEPVKPVPIPPPPGSGVIPDEEKPVKSFTNLEIAGYIGAIIAIAGLIGWFFSSC